MKRLLVIGILICAAMLATGATVAVAFPASPALPTLSGSPGDESGGSGFEDSGDDVAQLLADHDGDGDGDNGGGNDDQQDKGKKKGHYKLKKLLRLLRIMWEDEGN